MRAYLDRWTEDLGRSGSELARMEMNLRAA